MSEAQITIQEAGARSGLPPKTIRYYEDIGLVKPARGGNGYRVFDRDHLRRLRFLARARSLGFTIEDCRALLDLYTDRERSSMDVKRLAARHLDQIEQKIEELSDLRTTVRGLMEKCRGDERPDCPILDDLAGRDGGD